MDLTSQEGVLGPPSCCQPNHSALITDRNQTDYDVTDTVEGRQTNDDRRWTDEQTESKRQTDREKTDSRTDGQTGRKQSELS